MGTIHSLPGSIGFPRGSDRSGHDSAETTTTKGVFRRIVMGVWSVLINLQRRYEMRRALLDLDDRALKDLGLTRDDVTREADRMIRFG